MFSSHKELNRKDEAGNILGLKIHIMLEFHSFYFISI